MDVVEPLKPGKNDAECPSLPPEALPNPHPDALGNRVLKVNHAGEHGAVCIYAGQSLIARLTAPTLVEQLEEFRSHEEKHRAIFLDELRRRGVARCRSYWLCALGGLTLGMVTALFGRRAIAATTVAVERVVLRHLERQLAVLASRDQAAVHAISQIVAEERLHHDHMVSHQGANRFWVALLTPLVAISTEAVIWLGMHL